MFTQSQLRALRAARDACVAVKPMQEFGPKLCEVCPDFQDKLDELNQQTDYLEKLAGVCLAAVGE